MVGFFVSLAALLIVAWVVNRFNLLARFRRKSPPVSTYMLLWRAGQWEVVPVVVTDIGLEVNPNLVIPLGVASACKVGGSLLYVVAVEADALVDHIALERARRSILVGSLLRPGGDWMRWLQIGAAVVPVLAAIWMTLSFGAVGSSIATVRADVAFVRGILEHPLVIDRSGEGK